MADHDIGISTGAYHGLSLGAALLRIAELAPSAEILSLGRHSLLESINVRVIAVAGLPFTVHGPFAHFEFGSRSAAKHRGAIDVHRRHMWVAAELGAHLYVVHPDMQRRARGWNPKVAASLERAFEELAALQDEIGLPIAVENMPFLKHSHFIAPGDLDLKGLGLALDTGHAAMTGTLSGWLSDPLVDLSTCTCTTTWATAAATTTSPLGTGVIDIEPVLEVARAAGATHRPRTHRTKTRVLASLEHLREPRPPVRPR